MKNPMEGFERPLTTQKQENNSNKILTSVLWLQAVENCEKLYEKSEEQTYRIFSSATSQDAMRFDKVTGC